MDNDPPQSQQLGARFFRILLYNFLVGPSYAGDQAFITNFHTAFFKAIEPDAGVPAIFI